MTCFEMKFDASDRPTGNASWVEHAIRVKKAVYGDSYYYLLRNDRRRTPGDSVIQLEVADVGDRTMVRSLAGRGTASESRCL